MGTVVVLLESAFTGGEMIVNGQVVPFAHDPTEYELPWVAFHTDIVHEIRPVTSGRRVSLQFDLFGQFCCDPPKDWPFYRSRNVSEPDPNLEQCAAVVRSVVAYFNSEIGDLLLPTFHSYTMTRLHNATLKPIDDLLYRHLQEAGLVVTPVPLKLSAESDYEAHARYEYGVSLFWEAAEFNDKPRSFQKQTHMLMLREMQGRKLARRSAIEHTGNEAQPAALAYYFSALHIAKNDASAPPAAEVTEMKQESDDTNA